MKTPTTTSVTHYAYDPLDRLITVATAAKPQILRFYRKDRLMTETQGSRQLQIVHLDSVLLAEREHDGDITHVRALMTDYQGSVLQTKDGYTAYAPYGHRSGSVASTLGFNGQYADPVTGHYPLGNGHRFFNPVVMRFNSADRLSPFAEGGLNCYAYCAGDPVNRYDPSGQMFEAFAWLGMAIADFTTGYVFPLFKKINPLRRAVANNRIINSPQFKKASNTLVEASAFMGSTAFLARSALYNTDAPALSNVLLGITIGSAAGATVGSVTSTLNSFGQFLAKPARVIKPPTIKRSASLVNMRHTSKKVFRVSDAQSGSRSTQARKIQKNANRFKLESELNSLLSNRRESASDSARNIRKQSV